MENKYEIFGKKISGVFTIPSGIVTTKTTVLGKIGKEIPEVGILTTKSIGLKPKEGNREPIIAQYGRLSFINAVGLANPGADEFAKELQSIKIPKDKFLLISIFGKDENEFKKVAKKLFPYADGFEVNISCPHSEKYGQLIGQDNKLVEKIIKEVSSLGKPVFVKISPNLDVKETVRHVIKAGARGITAINTKGPESFLRDKKPVLSNKVGGVSGKSIFELGLKCIKEIREITDLPIIACGGISTAKDVKKYRVLDADYFGIGSALVGMNTDEVKEYFQELAKDIRDGTNKAVRLLKDKSHTNYKKFKVVENKRLAEDLFILELNRRIKIKPGQFIFAWLPEKGEKPLAAFNDRPLTLLIRKRGCFTKELSKLKKGEKIYIRGPYGNSPKIKGKILLVGGGTGIAALSLFAKKNNKTITLLGAKDKEHLPYQNFENICKKVYLSTENGEIGDKGLITEKLEEIIKKIQPDYCINCGPEPMVKSVIQKESKYIPLEKIYSAIDFLTKCGIGLCGSCATPKGYRSCVDGTFLKPKQIQDSK